ncbi:helix-turn-helix transcriptional regulator [Alphaproteobacteria bacterium KMM 3653]|uniref:Helix-turn-helix transcriptional regulator n=1 Tax=Harenicola maris TaxID=2841044 RepID=A0AAP2CMQ1_9RHOB|nr:helix-turn-helix transcriptional regulator [Harenicola maris]
MITNDDMDHVFHALAHTTRREILDHLRAEPGISVGDLAAKFDVSRIAVMNHLTILERAGLMTSEKQGRSRKLYINIMPIQEIHDRWTDTYSAYWADRLGHIKVAAEAAARAAKGELDNE